MVCVDCRGALIMIMVQGASCIYLSCYYVMTMVTPLPIYIQLPVEAAMGT
jgi:hypothetical protein